MQKRLSAGPLFRLFIIFIVFVTFQATPGCSGTEEEQLDTLPMQSLTLESLDSFQPVTENWSIAGGVESNRQVEHDLRGVEGTGILVNNPGQENNEHIFTSWPHGDLELELELLMPKGSNSGIYLMGRYEVQLFDSWGVRDPHFSDLGGIYQRWDGSRPEGQKGFEGHAPRMNAARAPGLWQHCRILFKAPEFNGAGEKTANARFREVWLNGVLIQENVEVTGPTRAAAFEDEQPEGPLMIQGDHGPVAIRNIRFKRYENKRIDLTDLNYEYVAGEFERIPDFTSLKIDETGKADSLAGNIVNRDDRYALRYTGTLDTPNSGTYLFKLQNAGTVRLLIGDDVVFDQSRPYRMHERASKTIELEGGRHSFILEYINHPNSWYRGLSLYAEGPYLRLRKLHASSSAPGEDRELPELMVEAGDRVKVLRSFAMHRGSKRTHVVNAGAPNGMNFNYDMGQAALLHAWEGPFVDNSEMWINRGTPQIAKPAGALVAFDGKPLLARLDKGAAWPDSISWDQLRVEGYRISESGWPVFKYALDDISVEDRFEGYVENRRLVRTVSFKASGIRENIWLKLASGKEIIRNKGEYVVDDRSYYLKPVETGGNEPRIVHNAGGYDLRIPVPADGTEAIYRYEIIW